MNSKSLSLSVALTLFVLQICYVTAAQASYGKSSPEVEGRMYTASCGYYSATVAELKFKYTAELEDGARVFLKYGSIGVDLSTKQSFSWNQIEEVEMTTTGRNLREVTIVQQPNVRGSSIAIQKVGFVFHIIYPNGEEWDNGFEQSPWGSYEINIAPSADLQCWSHTTNLPGPEFKKFEITENKKY